MQDGALPHFATVVCEWLNEHLSWEMVRIDVVHMNGQPRSPDLTP